MYVTSESFIKWSFVKGVTLKVLVITAAVKITILQTFFFFFHLFIYFFFFFFFCIFQRK